MAKTIAVSDDVYEMLVKAKLADESFSDAIRRNVTRGRRLMDIFGSRTISREDWKNAEAVLDRAQTISSETLKRRKNEAL